MTDTERAAVAGGCFWGLQDLIRRRPGVISTHLGDAGHQAKGRGSRRFPAGRARTPGRPGADRERLRLPPPKAGRELAPSRARRGCGVMRFRISPW
jgi:hypothetical protein